MKQNLKPSAPKLREPALPVTACLLHNEPASRPARRGQAYGAAEAKASANSAFQSRGADPKLSDLSMARPNPR